VGTNGLAWANKTLKGPTLLALSHSSESRLSEIHWWHLSFLRIWATLVSVDAFQLSLFSFIYSPSAQSSSFSPRILKLTPNLGTTRKIHFSYQQKAGGIKKIH